MCDLTDIGVELADEAGEVVVLEVEEHGGAARRRTRGDPRSRICCRRGVDELVGGRVRVTTQIQDDKEKPMQTEPE